MKNGKMSQRRLNIETKKPNLSLGFLVNSLNKKVIYRVIISGLEAVIVLQCTVNTAPPIYRVKY